MKWVERHHFGPINQLSASVPRAHELDALHYPGMSASTASPEEPTFCEQELSGSVINVALLCEGHKSQLRGCIWYTNISGLLTHINITPVTNHNKPYKVLIILQTKLSNVTLLWATWWTLCWHHQFCNQTNNKHCINQVVKLRTNIGYQILVTHAKMVTKVGGQNLGYQVWFCTRLLRSISTMMSSVTMSPMTS